MYNLTDIGTVKDILGRHGFHFSKSLGQNFIVNPSVCPRMAEESGIDENSGVIEIGAGIGVLTAELAKRYKKVIAFEIDKTLIPVLSYTLGEYKNVEVINQDILEVDLAAVLKEKAAGEKVSVCANLPYYITTPILMSLVECGYPFDSITVMVQAEVASRLAAKAGSADYGAITASLGYYGEVEKLFTVSAGNFMPAPKVNSAVVRLDLYKDKPVKPIDEKTFFAVIKAAFGQRRKTLVNALQTGFPSLTKEEITEAVTSLGFDERIRGEKLSTADFAALADKLV